MGKGVSLIAPAEHALLFGRLSDPEFMVEVFRRELPALAGGPLPVTRCRLKVDKSRDTLRQERLQVLYRVTIEGPEGEQEHLIVGIAPEPEDSRPAPEFLALCDRARGHPLVRPFRRLWGHVPGLRMTFQLFPVDAAMPALLEMTRPDCAGLLAPLLPDCREHGALLERVGHEIVHYRPADRCVLRLSCALRGAAAPYERIAYAKLFADPLSAEDLHEIQALERSLEGSRTIRLPQMLGCDLERRVVVTAEAPGAKIAEWLKCFEKDKPLPPGVDQARLERVMSTAAQGLVELHRCGVRLKRRRTMQSVLASLDDDLQWMRTAQPALADEVRGLLARLAGSGSGNEPLVPAHGCFSHKQMIGDERGLVVLDWDGATMAPSALDAADFLARLRQEPLRSPGTAEPMSRLAEVFRREFLSREPLVAAQDLAAHEALALIEKALRSLRRPGEARSMTDEIRHQLAAAAELLS